MDLLSEEQLTRWKEEGYLIVPSFFSDEETAEMLGEARRLLDEFDPTSHPMTTFKTAADGEHVGDDYFLNSGDKVRDSLLSYARSHAGFGDRDPRSQSKLAADIGYFLEPSSLSPATDSSPSQLLVPPAQSINKIGHALAVLNPVFRKYTLENERMRQVAKDLGEQEDPRVLQSMVICKQPRIGGRAVPCHNDSTFLYTDPPSAIGAWIALEECTPQNGCLSFLPGSHKISRTHQRFVRHPSGKGTTFIDVEGVEPNEEKWDEMDGWKEAACPAGTLVLIHGSVMHKSPPNPSDKSRLIYTFHMIEGGKGFVYDEKNW
ncbi:phytanoyl-CoA dioxygenase [Kwoniella heveanensis BCC8398]|uniref:Phytanoyl-CoA dioxygenase n=1 Tax=Kwoniella heveanensis BCC8398 TaxID=1296120 RepID=A0A1B9H4N7_9TREE|nr:phytanoyl-CoA dioxygenase [Kwoniella heveanensis BCC8398]